jgi:hypothetical protein
VAAWCDTAYYTDDYLLGRSPTIPEAEFLYWEKQAEKRINQKRVTVDDPPDCLKDCACAVAERLYLQSLAQGVRQGDGAANLHSFSNDGYSESYTDTLAPYRAMTKRQVDAEIAGIVSEYLSGTELHNDFIYRGV